jgi:predicted O-methyltransferase YrrM
MAEPHRDAAAKAQAYARRLAQPVYWPQLIRSVGARLGLRRKAAAPDAADVCAARARTLQDAFDALEISASASATSLGARHDARLAAARARVAAAGSQLGGGADIEALYVISRAIGARRIVETGVAFGWSSLAFLCALEDEGGGVLASVDLPYLGRTDDHLVGLAVPQELRVMWTLFRGADREMLGRAIALAAPIDLAHYDSDKSVEGRMWAYPRLFSALRAGGLLVSDDLQDNAAFFTFAESVGAAPIVVQCAHQPKYMGILRKPHA